MIAREVHAVPFHASFKRTAIATAAVVGTLLAAWVLFRFDPAKGYGYPLCLFHAFTGLNCPGCGCLRASHQLLHGNVIEAIHYNALFVLTLPAAAVVIFRAQRSRLSAKVVERTAWVGFIVIMIFGILRNVPGPLHVALSP